MSYAAKVLLGNLRRLLIVQAVSVVVAATVFLALKGWHPALAALFGGAIALFNSLVSAQRLARASDVASTNPKLGMAELYIGAVIRFVATPALIAVGIVLLKLDPVAIIVGFAAAQIAYFITIARPRDSKPN